MKREGLAKVFRRTIYRSETAVNDQLSQICRLPESKVERSAKFSRKTVTFCIYILNKGKKNIPREIKKQSFNVESKMERGYNAASTLISVSLARVLSETFYIKMLTQSTFSSFSTVRIRYAFSWHAFT